MFDHIKNKDQIYRVTMIGYLKKIKQRYHLKGYTGKKDFQEFFQYLETERMYQIQEKVSTEVIDQLVESVSNQGGSGRILADGTWVSLPLWIFGIPLPSIWIT